MELLLRLKFVETIRPIIRNGFGKSLNPTHFEPEDRQQKNFFMTFRYWGIHTGASHHYNFFLAMPLTSSQSSGLF